MIRKIIYTLIGILIVSACKIENDIPYPIVEGNIVAMEVEGQSSESGEGSAQAVINKANRTVQLYVDDSVDLTKLRVKKLTVTNDAALVFDNSICVDAANFPAVGFESADALNTSTNTRINFTNPVTMILQTYQDYDWNLTVTQVINRSILVDNQIGSAVIDPINKTAVIYVDESQALNAIKVSKFNLVGEHGKVVPNPVESDTYDFTQPCVFNATYGWETSSTSWTVYAYHKASQGGTISTVFPMTTGATLTGEIQSGKTPVVEYKKASDNAWTTLSASAITINGTSFTASLSSLAASSSYQVRVTVDGVSGRTETFTTAAKTPLTNASFDDWNSTGDEKRILWNPWSLGGTSFWDTGNQGATTVSSSNSVPTDDTSTGTGKAAYLESKYVFIKFAAGNIFTGEYVRTDGTNGVLSFGRPFTAFPSKLRINYKYTSSTIDKSSDDYSFLKGQADSCHIYFALTDWDAPREIRTKASERQLFDKNDEHIIAYAELIQGTTNTTYKQTDLVLNYRYKNRTPKYIVIVATASKYGDYFTGGTGSKLWLDDFQLIYD